VGEKLQTARFQNCISSVGVLNVSKKSFQKVASRERFEIECGTHATNELPLSPVVSAEEHQ
jgi:hypothetical protein